PWRILHPLTLSRNQPDKEGQRLNEALPLRRVASPQASPSPVTRWSGRATRTLWPILEDSSDHDHVCADGYSLIEVYYILIAHTDTTGRHRPADSPWRIGAMNPVKRRAQIKSTRPQRVFGPAFHVDRKDAALLLFPLDHLCGWPPIRPFALVGDLVRARPAKTILADAHAIATGHPRFQHQIEILLPRIDHDSPGRMLTLVVHFLWQEARIELKVRVIPRPPPRDLRRLIMLAHLLRCRRGLYRRPGDRSHLPLLRWHPLHIAQLHNPGSGNLRAYHYGRR